ncbi:MAG: hypothetical protein JRH03_00345 [Deltaproteobacteria bacterium]|nr:hypothetical protein [Deltaproteobacteria bacterium]
MRPSRPIPATLPWTAAMFLCVLLAGACLRAWAAQESVDASIKIPVVSANVAPGLIMTGPSAQGIEIHVAGSAQRIQALQESRLEYVLDLSGLNDGVHTIPIIPEQIQLPDGISILKLNTPSITIRIDKEIRKEVSVTVYMEGEAAPGFHVTGATASPGKAVLGGPLYILKNIEHIATNPIDIAGASESFKREITLDLVENVTVLFPSNPIIAQIDIMEKMITRTFENVAVLGRDTGFSFSISPPVISIDVKGPANVVNTLETSEEFIVYLDLNGLKPGVYVRRATIVLPVTTALVGVNPEIFTVTIKGK